MRPIPLLIFFLFCSSLTLAETFQGRVVGISDGDTVTVLDNSNVQTKIRLAGIDAPEKSQAFGQRSKEHLSDLIFGKTVYVIWDKKDRYGRTIGKILINNQDANLEQVKSGFAWHYKAYEREQPAADRQSYSQAENVARRSRLGLWLDAEPVPPWDYRHGPGEATGMNKGQSTHFCPCSGGAPCLGPKGGTYCVTEGGKKKYL